MFDYIINIRSHHTVACTKEIMQGAMRSTVVTSTCAEIADIREMKLRGEMSREDFDTKKAELKKRLPAFCFHAHFKNGRRLNADAIPSGLSIYDLDHINDPRGRWAQIAPRAKELGIVLAHVSPSCEGLRLVFILPEGMDLADGQKWLANQLGDQKFDEACKDFARCSFAVPESYVLYADYEKLFSPLASEEHEATDERHPLAGALTPLNPLVLRGAENVPAHKKCSTENHPSDSTRRIFDEAIRESGLSEENLNSVGTRHNSLITILSMGICRLMSEEQLKAVIAERMPDYSKEKDCQDLIRDFYQKYTDNNRPMSGKLRKIYTDSLKAKASPNPSKGGENTAGQDIDIDPDDDSSTGIPSPTERARERLIIHKLPIGLKESVEGVPDNMQMPVLCAVLPLAAAYADGVTVRYCDGATQRLGLMSIIVGPQASGKSACKRKVDLWERQMKDEDARAREIEERWRSTKNAKSANEKAPEDPMTLIRSVPATISCSALLRRFKNSRGHCLWTFCEELDTLRKTNGAGSWSAKYDVYRLGFDNGEWGQDYLSDQATSGIVNVAYNFSILGTYGALRKCFRGDNVENGLSSRIIIAEMPNAAFAPMPRYGQTRTDAAEAIDKAVTTLRSQTGFVDTPRLRRAIDRWEEDKRLEAMADGDLVKDTYRKRAGVIGFRCGVVARLLVGKESKMVVDFASLMAQYVLDEQLKIFGTALQLEYKKAGEDQTRQGSNNSLFDMLPPVFTLADLQQAKGPDVSRGTLQVIISRWKHVGWIDKVAMNEWKKRPRS